MAIKLKFCLTGNHAGERPLSDVPLPVVVLLAAALIAQILFHGYRAGPEASMEPLPAPVDAAYLRAASLGDPMAASRLLMLWLQAQDHQAGISIPFARLDYGRLTGWLEAVMTLDPRSHYPLLSAARIYSEVPDNAKRRIMLEFVYRKFLEAPDSRWPWLAHAVYMARHRMNDRELALKYARALRTHTSADTAPEWARQMELFVLADYGELESAQILLGGLIESGEITDQREIDFLMQRLGADEEE